MVFNHAQYKKGFLSPGFLINLCLLILGIFLLYIVSDYPDTARAFPRLVLMMILVATAVDSILMIRGKTGEKSSPEETADASSGQSLKVLYMVALMFVFYLFLNLFGLIIAVLFFLLFSGWTLGYRKPKRLVISSVIITALVYVIFEVIMNSILPEVLIFTIIGG
ncbi:MAG: tripartite tricarboxylate transporter TctB family protein [Pseudomonadota bacterium]